MSEADKNVAALALAQIKTSTEELKDSKKREESEINLAKLTRESKLPEGDIEKRAKKIRKKQSEEIASTGFVPNFEEFWKNEDLKKQLEEFQKTSLRGEAEALLEKTQEIDGVKLVVGLTSAASADGMREMGDFLKDKLGSVVLALAAVVDDNPILVTMVTSDLVERGLHAGNIARDTAKVMGGGGGGRPEMAQAGGKQPGKVAEALEGVPRSEERRVGKECRSRWSPYH